MLVLPQGLLDLPKLATADDAFQVAGLTRLANQLAALTAARRADATAAASATGSSSSSTATSSSRYDSLAAADKRFRDRSSSSSNTGSTGNGVPPVNLDFSVQQAVSVLRWLAVEAQVRQSYDDMVCHSVVTPKAMHQRAHSCKALLTVYYDGLD